MKVFRDVKLILQVLVGIGLGLLCLSLLGWAFLALQIGVVAVLVYWAIQLFGKSGTSNIKVKPSKKVSERQLRKAVEKMAANIATPVETSDAEDAQTQTLRT